MAQMNRLHLFEFEDFSWFPGIIRDGGTDFLGFILKLTQYYTPVTSVLENALKTSGYTTVFDMASGNGGPIESICEAMDAEMDIVFYLSDKYPNLPAYEKLRKKYPAQINYHSTPVDVLNMPVSSTGFRTIFSAIHHFKPPAVRTILQQAIRDNTPIGIFDSGDKHIGTILGILFVHPVLFFFCTPFFMPFKWSRILFTYIIPLIPLYTIWDGVVSILRLYRPQDLAHLAQQADTDNVYKWECGKVKNKFGFSVTYLIGMPKHSSKPYAR